MRAFLLAGWLEFALGVAFPAAPVARIEFCERQGLKMRTSRYRALAVTARRESFVLRLSQVELR
jgi:hypothetical protein